VARKNKTNRLWSPSPSKSKPTISVIERGDPEEDRAGLPFGFGRVLVEEEQRAIALGKHWLEEYAGMSRRQARGDGWDEHMEALTS